MLARFSPSKYVNMLHEIPVPGYTEGNGRISITRYISANPRFGGNAASRRLHTALKAAETDPEARARLNRGAADEVFGGQGMPHHIAWVMSRILLHRQALSRVPEFAPILARPHFLQAVCDEGLIGMDCIGFVGTYLAASGVHPHYGGNTPETFLNEFALVSSLDEVRELCVVVVTSYAHVQIIDRVVERSSNRLIVDLCQSTSSRGGARGPQFNRRVSLTLGRGDYVAIDDVAIALRQHGNRIAGERGDDLWDQYRASTDRPSERDFARWLRPLMLQRAQTRGTVFRHSGAIFNLGHNGNPANPVGGSVFVGAKANLLGAA